MQRVLNKLKQAKELLEQMDENGKSVNQYLTISYIDTAMFWADKAVDEELLKKSDEKKKLLQKSL